MANKIINTSDGSYSIYVPELDETYHSRHGALQEAIHVFIDSGLSQVADEHLKVFEVGFGTGLNCLLSMRYAKENNKKLFYTGIEKYPVKDSLIQEISHQENPYTSILDKETFINLHELPWDTPSNLNESIEIIKINDDWKTFEPSKKFNIIFYDAFGHRAQESMWAKDLLEKCFYSLQNNGIFVTYAAKGQLRRDLESCGFTVERLPGPPGKREMLRAVKNTL